MAMRGEEANWNPCSADLAITILIYYEVYSVLRANADSAEAVLEGVPSAKMVGNCVEEFSDLRWLLFIGVGYTLAKIGFGYLTALKPDVRKLVVLGQTVETILLLILLCLTCQGAYLTLFNYSLDDIKHCEDLHNMAWWLFVCSILIICVPAVVITVMVVVKVGLSGASAREHVAAVDDSASAKVDGAYAKLPDEQGPLEES
mmetsp:Transcript_12618/g.16975  ORF Transcript_12618/g.16975 Transcript_12618/m.16975 type:complete len:202 (-) Transcript_12618:127-732(-)